MLDLRIADDLDRGLSTARATAASLAARKAPSPPQNPYASNINTPYTAVGGGSEVAAARSQYEHFRGAASAAILVAARRISGQPVVIGKAGRPANASRSFESHIKSGMLRRKDVHPSLKRYSPDEIEIITDHKIYDLIEDPNDFMLTTNLWMLTVANLLITGRTLWVVNNNPDRPELIPIPTTWATPIHDYASGKLNAKWSVKPPGSNDPAQEVDGALMLNAYFADPEDPLSCISMLQLQADAILASEAIGTAQRVSFKNEINPSMAVIVGDAATGDGKRQIRLEPAQRRQLIQWLRQEFAGAQKFGTPMIMDALVRDIKNLRKSPSEVGFLESDDATLKRIFLGFGVPLSSAGMTEGTNYASSAVADHNLCLPAGTPILTRRGWIGVEEVCKNDIVMSHAGEWRRVGTLQKNHFSGNLISIRVKGVKDAVSMTPDHPVLVLREGREMWISAKDVGMTDRMSMPRIRGAKKAFLIPSDYVPCVPARERRFDWLDDNWLKSAYRDNTTYGIAEHCGCEATCLQKRLSKMGVVLRKDGGRFKSRTLNPAPFTRTRIDAKKIKGTMPIREEIDKDIAMWLGLYLAEGHGRQGHVIFSLHEDEHSLQDLVVRGFSRLTDSSVKKTYYRGNHAVQVGVGNSTLCAVLSEMFGCGAKHKQIPSCVFDWPEDLRIAFLAGYVCGDGDFRKHGVGFATASRYLALGIRALCASVGGLGSVGHFETKKGHQINGREIKSGRLYHGVIGASLARKISEMSGQPMAPTKKFQPTDFLVTNERVWARVVEIFDTPHSGDVFNFSVDADESYLTPIGAVHNCTNCVNPICKLLSEAMTAWLAPLFGRRGEKLKIWIVPAEAYDPDLQIRRWTAARQANAVSRNEFRTELLGLGKIDGLDDTVVQGAMRSVPMGERIELATGAPQAGGEGSTVSGPPTDAADNENMRQERKEFVKSYIDIWLKVQASAERRFAAPIQQLIKAQVDSAVAQVRAGERDADQVFDASQWDDRIRAMAEPVVRQLMVRGASMTLSQPQKAAVLMDLPDSVARAIDQQLRAIMAAPFWHDISLTTKAAIVEALQDGIGAGDTLKELTDRLERKLGDGWVRSRAAAIARTESAAALNAGHYLSHEELAAEGISYGLEWFSLIDDVTRPDHVEVNGQKVHNGEMFEVGGYLAPYPGHHSLPAKERVNCRCTPLEITEPFQTNRITGYLKRHETNGHVHACV